MITPGPWAFDEDRNVVYSTTKWFIESNEEESEEGLPTLVISTLAACGGDDPSADIRLIVAAPELLDIAMRILAEYDFSLGGTIKPLTDETLDELKQIVKKATTKT